MSQTRTASAPQVYDKVTIRLHWITAALVAVLWLMATTDIPLTGGVSFIDYFQKGQPRVVARSMHITLGVVLILVMLYRIFWRSTAGRKLPPVSSGITQTATSAMHYALYAGLIAVLVLGLANVWIRGDSIFGLFNIPAFKPNDRPLRELAGEIHGWAANLVLIAATLHAAVALVHHYAFRDDVLRRMLSSK